MVWTLTPPSKQSRVPEPVLERDGVHVVGAELQRLQHVDPHFHQPVHGVHDRSVGVIDYPRAVLVDCRRSAGGGRA